MSDFELQELNAMSKAAEALGVLEEDAQKRVMRWLIDYYGISAENKRDPLIPEHAAQQPNSPLDSPPRKVFNHFGDLYAAVDPKTNEEKALVAAYWHQVVLGEETWQSASLQKDLRDLGQALANISDALISAVEKRPQKVIQLKKSGQAKQARKTFKLSQAGIDYVRDRIS